MGEVIDRELPGDKKSRFFAHLNACLPCRNEYELELLAKNVLQKTLKHIPTPSTVSHAIIDLIRSQIPAPAEDGTWMSRFFAKRFLASALSAAIIVIALVGILMVPQGSGQDEYAHTTPNDIIYQSLDNFALVNSGELKPSMVACYSDVVIGYFQRQGVEFAVSVIADDSCDWFGAIANSYEGVKLAHIVYKRGNDLLYVYEVGKKEALEGSVLSLPAAAKASLVQTGWYTDPQHDGCNVVLWTVNETLCAAVSNMNKDRLLALLIPVKP